MMFNKMALAITSAGALILSSCTLVNPETPEVNESPVIISVGPSNGVYSVTAQDPEGDPLLYSWEVDGVSYGSKETFTPQVDGIYGDVSVTVKVTDSANNQATKTIPMNFGEAPNESPTLEISKTGDVYTIVAQDPESDSLTYSWKIDGFIHSEEISLSAESEEFVGLKTVTASVKDSAGNEAELDLEITFFAPNMPPVLTYSELDGVYTATATDPENDEVTFSWVIDGEVVSTESVFDSNSQSLFGIQVITLTAEDSNAKTAMEIITKDYGQPVNEFPVVDAGLTIDATVGIPFILDATATDADMDSLTYSWFLSDGQSFFGKTQSVTINQSGTYIAEVIVSDTKDTVDDRVTIVVAEPVTPNEAPIAVAGTNVMVATEQVVTLNGTATDAENDFLIYSWEVNGNTYDSHYASMVFHDEGTYIATLSVFDGVNTSTDTLTITVGEVIVNPANNAPVITSITANATTLMATATDADNDSLTYTWSVAGQEIGMGSSLLIDNVPSSVVGVQTAVVSVSDGMNAVTALVAADFGVATNEEIVDDYEGNLPVNNPSVLESAQAILDAYDGSLPVPENVTKAAALLLADTTGQEVSGGVIYIPTVEGGQPTVPFTVQVTQTGEIKLVPLPVPHIFDYGTANSFILDDFADNDHQNNLGGAVGTIHCENYTEGGGYWYVFGENGATSIKNAGGLDINPYNIIEAVANEELHIDINGGEYAGVGTNLVFEEYPTTLTDLEYVEVTLKGSGSIIPMFEPIASNKPDWGNYAADEITLTGTYQTYSIPVADFIGEEYSDIEGESFVSDGQQATKFFLQAKSDTGVDVEIYISKIEFFGNGLSIEDIGYKGLTKQESEDEIAHCNLDRGSLDVPTIAESPNLDYEAFALKHGELGQANDTVVSWVAPSLASTGNLNWLTRDGRILKDSNDNPVRLTGVNWFGFETKALITMGLWEGGRTIDQMLGDIVTQGFNTVRIPFSDEVIAGSLNGSILLSELDIDLVANPVTDVDNDSNITPLDLLDVIINKAQALNLKVVLDSHSRGSDKYLVEGHWVGDYGTNDFGSEAKWIEHWEMLADRYKDNDAVVAFDLNNEPHFEAAWGSADASKNWNEAAQRAGNAIQAINSNVLIIVEGVEHLNGDQETNDAQKSLDSYWWGGNLQGVSTNPINITDNSKLVYSPHEYGPEVYVQPWFKVAGFPRNLPYLWEDRFGYIYQENIGHLFVGEFGIKNNIPTSASNIWFDTFVEYMCERKEGYSWTFWAWNPNSGDTGGILGNDWAEVNDWKVDKLRSCQAPLIGNNNG